MVARLRWAGAHKNC